MQGHGVAMATWQRLSLVLSSGLTVIGHVPPSLAWAPNDHRFRPRARLHTAHGAVRHLEALTKGQSSAASRPLGSHSRRSMALRPDGTSDRKAFSCWGRVAGQRLPPNSSQRPLRHLLS